MALDGVSEATDEWRRVPSELAKRKLVGAGKTTHRKIVVMVGRWTIVCLTMIKVFREKPVTDLSALKILFGICIGVY